MIGSEKVHVSVKDTLEKMVSQKNRILALVITNIGGLFQTEYEVSTALSIVIVVVASTKDITLVQHRKLVFRHIFLNSMPYRMLLLKLT